MKVKVKYPKFLFMDTTGYHPEGMRFEHCENFGFVEPILGEDGIAVQRPGEMLVNIMYPFHRAEVWVPHKALFSNDAVCLKFGSLIRQANYLQGELHHYDDMLGRMSVELRTLKEKEALEEK